jgi:hypothetical protein
MKSIKLQKERMSVQMQRLLMMMATIMMAFATLTACDILEDNNDENGKEEEGGNGGGGVSGKRIKTQLITNTSGTIQRGEYTYNNDGSIKRSEWYDASSKMYCYINSTNNPDGSINKEETFYPDTDMTQVLNYTYDANKKYKKAEGAVETMGQKIPITFNFTFQNGRLIRYVLSSGSLGSNSYSESIFEQNYDANGRRTTTNETHSVSGTRKYTRTYNSDGTLQKVTADAYSGIPNSGCTYTFTWENGKTTINFDDYNPY